jgi:SOS-response transcriptional repressor LexA
VATGRRILIKEYVERSAIPVPRVLIRPYSASKLKAVFVSGDSMTDEKVFDGDIVIFCPQLVAGDAVYVVSVDNTLLVKRIAFNNISQSITLISTNNAYLPRVIGGEELKSVKIEGRVVACLHWI